MRPELVFQNIYDLMRFGSTISNITEVSGISTITTDNLYSLQNGMLVEISNRAYVISNVTIVSYGVYTFDVTASNLSASEWSLALYYEYGRALEINLIQKDKKEDPLNKNKRFPLMWLLTDIEKDEDFRIGYQAEITIAFIYLSEEDIRTEKRIERNMQPILDPLVALFKNTIKTSPGSRYFIYPYGENLNIDETDKFKYGSVTNNTHVFDDIADAIELNMTLRINVSNSTCIIN